VNFDDDFSLAGFKADVEKIWSAAVQCGGIGIEEKRGRC